MSNKVTAKKPTHRFKGTFNYKGDQRTFFTTARDSTNAYNNIIRRLAKIHDTSRTTMHFYFRGSDHYHIEELPDVNTEAGTVTPTANPS